MRKGRASERTSAAAAASLSEAALGGAAATQRGSRGLGGHLGIAPAAPTRGTQHSSKVYWVKCACAFPIIASLDMIGVSSQPATLLLPFDSRRALCNPKQL
jgi:hypothetical protein